jgi:hypothetical protein
MSCTDELHLGVRATGTDVVKQRVYRSLTTTRGSCVDCPDRGIDVRDWLNADDAVDVEGSVVSECLRDSAVIDAKCIASTLENTISLDIRLTLRGGAVLPFTVLVGSLTAEMISP